MKKEMTMKEKRFSFFADPQERKAESRPTFGTLPFARHTSLRFAKVKEPNLSNPHLLETKNIYRKTHDTLANLSYSSTYHKNILPILGTRTANLKSNNMKRIFTLFTALFVISFISHAQTTLEEYNYITKGYKVQIESGLDMKKGYTLKDLGYWGLTFGAEVRNVAFKGLYRSNETKPCAIMMIYKRTDISTGAIYYICIPHPKSDESIWKSTLDFVNTNTSEKNTSMSTTMIWALMKFASQEATQ